MKRIVLIALVMLVVAVSVQADIQQKFQIQGVLKDNGGVVMPDGDYSVNFKVYDAPTGGQIMWSDDSEIIQENGVFTALLLDFNPDTFHQDTWLEMTFEGESPMMPRTPITPVPVALAANSVDPDNAVVGLNGKKGNVTLVGGTNVTVVPSGSTNEITIHATAGTGGADTDWVIDGEDITHQNGRVIVGTDVAYDFLPPNKMSIRSDSQGLVVQMDELNPDADGRAAIFGLYNSTWGNQGSNLDLENCNSAIVGYNRTAPNYSFGIRGYSGFGINKRNVGAILGKQYGGNIWAALAFVDSNLAEWGLYTPSPVYLGSQVEIGSLKIPAGAQDGYLLSTDADGNAVWSPPSAVENDGDWTISGDNLYHGGTGSVAIGSSNPQPYGGIASRTTMQITGFLNPALALDATNGGLTRWTMAIDGGAIEFNKSSSYNSLGTTAMSVDEGMVEVKRFNGATGIRLQGEGSNESGSKLDIYSTSTSTTLPTVSLDGQSGTSSNQVGGVITLRDYSGQGEVVITANHNNTQVGRVITPVLEITGGSDLSEQFDIGNASQITEPGMVVSIDPENPGQLTLSDRSYDRRVAGVISGAGGVNTGMVMGQRGTVADGELPVALVGRVYVWADASSGSIEPGDLLTTSDRPGHAMKVTDHGQATGAILGKAMTGLTEGQGLILTLVTLQ